MGGALGAATAGGGALLGGVSDYKAAAKAKKSQKKQIKKTQGVYMDALDRTRALGAKGEAAQLKILPLLQQGQQKALGITGALGRGTAQGIADRSQQMMGDVQQRLASTGLYNTTQQGSLARGVSMDSSRAMLELQQALAGVQSGIVQQGAGQQAQALSGLSGYYQNMSAQEAAIMQELARYLGGIQHMPGPSILGSLAGLMKGVGGMGGFGGGGGAAGGSGGAGSIFPGAV